MERKTFIKSIAAFTAMGTLTGFKHLADTLPASEKMPVLFLGHGSPMNAIEENEFVLGFKNLADTLTLPTAIVCVSAHWFTKGTHVTAMEVPQTIHDFGGFPKELFDVQYPAKGDPQLASETKQLLLPTEVGLDEKWGLDHGSWSVIKHLYPEANVPVIQLSIDYTQPAQYHFDLAKKLSTLREKGVLIVGSGNIIHNLRMVDFANFEKDDYGYDWAIETRTAINKHLLDGNFQALIDYEKQGEAFKLAIPTPEHYLPLIYSLGLKEENEELALFNDKLLAGSLSMTSVKIG